MENSIYLGLSRQMTLRTNMDIVANNIANMNTPGFRAQNTLFQEFISNPRGGDDPAATDPLSFVYDRGQYQITNPGALRQTNGQLDIALVGPGFMGVLGPDGLAYSRAGNLQRSDDGKLVSSAGFPIADVGGASIDVPDNAATIKIDKNGVISNDDGPFGQIMLTEFANEQTLDPMGNNLYKASAAGTPATQTVVKQGFIEGSNVQPFLEITSMIETLRAFQSTQQILQTENERLRTAIQRLTRSS